MIPSWGAVLVGAAAGVLVPMASVWIELKVRIDDPTAGIATHAVGGFFGTITVGFLMPGTFLGRLAQIGTQTLGAIVCLVLAGSLSMALFVMMKLILGLRVKEADEYDGLDLAQHDVGAYPDFQQNTIRSFHLREA